MRTFNYLTHLSNNIKARYVEVENMVKVSSSSFYDALGNLLEDYLYWVAQKNGIVVEFGASHGKLSNALKPFLIETIKISDNIFQNIKRISGRINTHKHNSMQYLTLEICLYNLKSFFDFYAGISKYSCPEFMEYFDSKYFYKIYGMYSSKKINELLKELSKITKESNSDINNIQNRINKYIYFTERLTDMNFSEISL